MLCDIWPMGMWVDEVIRSCDANTTTMFHKFTEHTHMYLTAWQWKEQPRGIACLLNWRYVAVLLSAHIWISTLLLHFPTLPHLTHFKVMSHYLFWVYHLSCKSTVCNLWQIFINRKNVALPLLMLRFLSRQLEKLLFSHSEGIIFSYIRSYRQFHKVIC